MNHRIDVDAAESTGQGATHRATRDAEPAGAISRK
jgi:hypothetical protein